MFISYRKRLDEFLSIIFLNLIFSSKTIFLQHALGVLNVQDEQMQTLAPENLWNRFLSQDENFPIKYAVYYYFRSVGWIVKSGLKFGCDYSK